MNIDKELKRLVQKRLGCYVKNDVFAHASDIAEDILASWMQDGRRISDHQILLAYVLATKMSIMQIEYVGEDIS